MNPQKKEAQASTNTNINTFDNQSLNPNALQKAIGLFDKDDDDKIYLGGAFGSLKVSLKVNAGADHIHHHIAYHNLSAAAHDIWNIAALVERLEWMRQLAIEQKLLDSWRTYAKLDVSHIIYEFRSIFDHIASAIGNLSSSPGSMPKSFEKLIKNLEHHQCCLGKMYEPLNRDFTWFYDLRVMRTAIIHKGSEPLVFDGPEDGILFQVHGSNYKNLITVPEFMFNENVVRLEPYVAYYFAELLAFLNDLTSAAISQTELPLKLDGVRNYCSGYNYLVTWMKSLYQQLSETEI